MSIKILLVDDDEVTRALLGEVLERAGYSVQLASTGEEAVQLLRKNIYPIIVSDIRMVEMGGIAVLQEAKKQSVRSTVILMTGFGSMEGAIEAIQEGAFDYISKPFQIDEFKAVIARAAKHWESVQKESLQKGQPVVLDFSTRSLIGKSPCMLEVYKILARAALSSSTVLVTGESGTGKELVARAIHGNSPRKLQQFIAFNCGALSDNLLESELFGHVKGSFTGAISNKKGLFEEASGGTLFLDEIGDITPALQIRLLRVLQENEFKPVGSVEIKKSNVRLITATHRDLESLVREGRFREDLYYRLKVISIHLPSLRDRIDDLPYLAEHFLAKYSDLNKKTVSHITPDAMLLLKNYSWPGNIRELEHAIERAVAMTSTVVLFPEDFPIDIQKGLGMLHIGNKSSVVPSAGSSLEELEKKHIIKTLQDVHFNKSKASEILGIDRATLYRKAQKYGIELRIK